MDVKSVKSFAFSVRTSPRRGGCARGGAAALARSGQREEDAPLRDLLLLGSAPRTSKRAPSAAATRLALAGGPAA